MILRKETDMDQSLDCDIAKIKTAIRVFEAQMHIKNAPKEDLERKIRSEKLKLRRMQAMY